MNFPTWRKCDDPRMTNGTSKRGTLIDVPYSVLVKLFGEPELIQAPEDKVDCEWMLIVTDEYGEQHIVTIYNWKDGYNYCGAHGKPVHLITEWNIGGNSFTGASLVEHAAQSARHAWIEDMVYD